MNDQVKEKIRNVLRLFNEQDKPYLWSVDIYEPTLSHRIAVYLEQEFPGYVVDCEYNKNIGDPKRDDNGNKIRPDIIIHIRNDPDNNLAIFEIKKSGKDSQLGKADIGKLMRSSNLNYQLGIFVGVLKNRIDIGWLENGSNNMIFETI